MEIKFFSPRWGYEDEDFEYYCTRLVAAGFDGMEFNLAENRAEAEKQIQLLAANGLEYIAQHSSTQTAGFEAHRSHYRANLERIAAFKPRFINAHTGRDFFTFEQNLELIDIAVEISEASDVPVVHETHRGRFPFSAALTSRYLEKRPGLRLTADFSHWCCVSESFLQDQAASVNAAIERTDHIHARIGHDQGPQVNDPRAPEWQEAVDIYLGWWDQIIASHAAKGSAVLTITTEFGPPPYTPLIPYTQEPVSSQWELNLHMLDVLKSRYASSEERLPE
jgi:sugar phosphate isomerase/epimerase